MPITEEENTLFELRNLARRLGLWVGQHRTFDPVLGGGPFFVMPRKEHKEQINPTLLKFATAEMVEEFIEQYADNHTDADIVRMVPSERD